MAYGSGASLRAAKGGIGTALAKLGTKMPLTKKLAGTALGFMPGGALLKTGMAAAAGAAAARGRPLPAPRGPLAGMGIGSGAQAKIGSMFGGGRKKYRRMNPANVKALKRAMKRQDAFVALANDALRGSGYRVGRTAKSVAPKKKCR